METYYTAAIFLNNFQVTSSFQQRVKDNVDPIKKKSYDVWYSGDPYILVWLAFQNVITVYDTNTRTFLFKVCLWL